MEEFFPFTYEDISKLRPIVAKERFGLDAHWDKPNKNTIKFLHPLATQLIKDPNKITKLKQILFQEEARAGRGSFMTAGEGFLELVKIWLEENNGRVNFTEIVNLFELNDLLEESTEILKEVILSYSLPLVSGSYSLWHDLKENLEGSLWEKALENYVILGVLFTNLGFEEKKKFRLASPFLTKETLSLWRKQARMNVYIDKPQNSEFTYKGISFTAYMDMLQNYKQHPFHCFKLMFGGVKPFNCEAEEKYWSEVGPNIEDLQVGDGRFKGKGLVKFCERLLLDVCPNLKKLRILPTCLVNDDLRTFGDSSGQNKNRNYAKNLHTLIIDVETLEKTAKNILFLCPNLKVLSLECEQGLDALSRPTATGEFIKLEKLTVSFTLCTPNELIPVRKYFEILARANPPSLQHLHLKRVDLNSARSPPYQLYSALRLCSTSLKTLELELHVHPDHGLENCSKWFSDLAQFSFPELTQLKLTFTHRFIQYHRFGKQKIKANFQMKFDFASLKGMPKLEGIDIRAKNKKVHVVRNPGDQDWIFQGPRNNYFPTGHADFSSDPVFCPQLKEFTFLGWSLTREDLQLLCGWFPNLSYLDCEVAQENLPIILEKWQKMEKLCIETERLISLRELRPLKVKREGIKITQVFRGKASSRFVEMKESNKILYFTFNGIKDDILLFEPVRRIRF